VSCRTALGECRQGNWEDAMPKTATEPLNILFLMTDQHRADHVGFLPGSRFAMPNLDRLADGTAFSNCVTVNPICTPARTALLTGKYTHQIGTLSMSGDLSLQHPTYFQALQRAGYFTAGIGKFHWLQGWPWQRGRGQGHDLVALRETMQGFGLDYVWETAGKQLALRNYCEHAAHLERRGLLEAYRDHIEVEGRNVDQAAKVEFTGKPWPFPEEDYVDVLTGDKILECLRQRPKDRPFCIFGSFCGPHAPFDPPDSYLQQVPYEEVDDFIVDADGALDTAVKKRLWTLRRSYRAMLLAIDAQVGRILAALQADNLLDRTLILFTSDHGEMLGDHQRFQKSTFYRQAVTVPTLVRHPHHLDRRLITSPTEIIDLTATLLDAAGLDWQAELSLPWPAFNNLVPCRSLLPVVRGSATGIRDTAFSECSGQWQMLQTEHCKYVRFLDYPDPDQPRELLFDLEADPGERHNRAADPAQAERLNGFRRRREWLLDRTPTAQLRWAPIIGN
jgi:choline-sulfatase